MSHSCQKSKKRPQHLNTLGLPDESTDRTDRTGKGKRQGLCFLGYLLTRELGDKTHLAVDLFVRGNPILQMIFRVLMQKKLKTFFERSIANLSELCEKEKKQDLTLDSFGLSTPRLL